MSATVYLERLANTETLVDLLQKYLTERSTSDQAMLLVARGLASMRALSMASNDVQFRLGMRLLTNETVRLSVGARWINLTVAQHVLEGIHPTDDLARRAQESFLEFFKLCRPSEGQEQREGWRKHFSDFEQQVPLWERGNCLEERTNPTRWWTHLGVQLFVLFQSDRSVLSWCRYDPSAKRFGPGLSGILCDAFISRDGVRTSATAGSGLSELPTSGRQFSRS